MHLVDRLGGEFVAVDIDRAQVLRQPRQVADAVYLTSRCPQRGRVARLIACVHQLQQHNSSDDPTSLSPSVKR